MPYVFTPSSSSNIFALKLCGCSETEKCDELMGVDIILFDDKSTLMPATVMSTVSTPSGTTVSRRLSVKDASNNWKMVGTDVGLHFI
ncbi:hypothetical protein HID58_095420 [Brassica napus]|uniref:Uncharacterized protein n=1 Tax=Brassica napus TaxID=3708 RepID=A0ABQ7X3T1_BRANA|nr:hypothetical protein HID58_095420 [Brassica napus]